MQLLEKRQGIKMSVLEEIAYINGWIDKAKLLQAAEKYGKSPYGEHLRKVVDNKIKY